jgi:TolB-like protein/class 3 adenylate cyclase/tetratricopeptide (TPR) repeat protein
LEAHSVERKLAAIFAADVEGYSRLMGLDEVGTLRTLTAYRVIIDRLIASHRGRIFNTAGDSILVDFASAVDAVQCAVAVQDAIGKENTDRPVGEQMRFRIGIHVGDIIVQGDNLFGDAVNIAARLEALADPGGICVSGTVRDHIGTKLPLTFADIGEQQVKNIAQPVKAYRIRGETSPSTTPVLTSSLPLPDKPSIAVMPFQNMSDDPEQEYFADGMVEEIITALSRIRWLFVIARNSTFTYKGQAIDVKQVGRELGVRYVLEGSVRKAGQRVRITGQLIDALTGTHLWADRFDGSLEDIFELQDKVATSVAGIIEPTLQSAEIRRSSERPTSDLTAYDIYLRALANFPWAGRARMEALSLFEQAIARDPGFAAALAWAAVCHTRQRLDGYAEDPETSRRKARSLAEQALALGGGDPGVLANVALVLGDDESAEISSAIALIDRSLDLNPSSARAWFISGLLRVLAGECDKAIEHLQTCLRLGPRDPVGVPLYAMGLAHLFSRRFIDAAEKLALSVHAYSGWPAPYRALAACYAHMGRLEDARAVIEQLRSVGALTASSEINRYRRAEDRELLLSGLHMAAGEAHNPEPLPRRDTEQVR